MDHENATPSVIAKEIRARVADLNELINIARYKHELLVNFQIRESRESWGMALNSYVVVIVSQDV